MDCLLVFFLLCQFLFLFGKIRHFYKDLYMGLIKLNNIFTFAYPFYFFIACFFGLEIFFKKIVLKFLNWIIGLQI